MRDLHAAAGWAGLTAFVWYAFGALIALVVAATPFSVLGITSAFWVILAGLAASGFAERKQVLDFWTGK